MGDLVACLCVSGKKTLIYCWNLLVFQMVGVSDDVNEYAMALKDTEEKISRCPKRVSVSGLPASFSGRASVSDKKDEAQWAISSLGAADVLDRGSNPCLELTAAFHTVPTHCTTASRNRGTEATALDSPEQAIAACKPPCAADTSEPVSWGGDPPVLDLGHICPIPAA